MTPREAHLEALRKLITCGQGCDALAVERFLWPGADWLPACPTCLARAIEVARVMGFQLQREPVKQPDGLFPPPRMTLVVD